MCLPPSAAPGKPSLTVNPAQPVDGSPMTLTCTSTNKDITKYQFYKDNRQIGKDTQNNTYTVSGVKFTDAGQYFCKAFKENFPTSSDKKTLNGMISLFLCFDFFSFYFNLQLKKEQIVSSFSMFYKLVKIYTFLLSNVIT